MRRRECGLQLYDAVGVAHGDRAASGAQAARNFVLFDAPHVAIVTSRRELGAYGAVDCGAYVGTFQIGRAACRERVCQYVELSVVAVSLKKKKYNTNEEEK